MLERRRALDGSLPRRVVRTKRKLELPAEAAFDEVLGGSGKQAASTTMAFTRLLRNLCRDPKFGPRVVPIIPDEARTFGMDSLFKEFGIYASQGQHVRARRPRAAAVLQGEPAAGRSSRRASPRPGSMASFIAAGTSYATHGVPMVPFFTFYSMFGFQRVGDLIWQAGDARARGFLLGATAGRTTLLGEGLQHQDGHSLLLASVNPVAEAYDPAFAYEVATIVRHGLRRMWLENEDVFYYLTLYNENQVMPADARGRRRGRDRGPLPLGGGARRAEAPGHDPVLRLGQPGGPRGAARAGRALRRRRRAVVGHQLQAAARGGAVHRALEPAAPRPGRRARRGSPSCSTTATARSSPSPTS